MIIQVHLDIRHRRVVVLEAMRQFLYRYLGRNDNFLSQSQIQEEKVLDVLDFLHLNHAKKSRILLKGKEHLHDLELLLSNLKGLVALSKPHPLAKRGFFKHGFSVYFDIFEQPEEVIARI